MGSNVSGGGNGAIGTGKGHGYRRDLPRMVNVRLARRLAAHHAKDSHGRSMAGLQGYRRPGSQTKPYPLGSGRQDARDRSRRAVNAR